MRECLHAQCGHSGTIRVKCFDSCVADRVVTRQFVFDESGAGVEELRLRVRRRTRGWLRWRKALTKSTEAASHGPGLPADGFPRLKGLAELSRLALGNDAIDNLDDDLLVVTIEIIESSVGSAHS